MPAVLDLPAAAGNQALMRLLGRRDGPVVQRIGFRLAGDSSRGLSPIEREILGAAGDFRGHIASLEP